MGGGGGDVITIMIGRSLSDHRPSPVQRREVGNRGGVRVLISCIAVLV